ncbi:MAG: M23 family metallopeptidase [Acidobacteria bacterium]|nr:M23 family metallopeptidase [Acidobacteriota bacterium]
MSSFLSRRYTLVVVDRASGVGRRFSVKLGWTLASIGFFFALPVLVGLGIRWGTLAELTALRSNTVALAMENASYRAATGELTTQVTSLQGVIDELGTRSALDPEVAKAMQKLPALIKSRAMGGARTSLPPSLLASALSSPEDTFGLLRNVLGRLESQLRVTRTGVERREALAAATPSIWPTVGWLSARYGERADPLTGDPGYHQGLDLSADRGTPVVATADGVVESAAWSGNYGNLLVIDHGFGIKTRYGHLSAFAASVGAKVRRNEVIGYVGATGRTTGSHLHYEVMTNGQTIDPLLLLSSPR